MQRAPTSTTWQKLSRHATTDQDLKKRGHFGSVFSANQYAWAYQKVAHYCKPEAPVLDWGCGNGHFSLFLCDQGFHSVHGYAFRPPSLLSLLSQQDAFSFHLGDRTQSTSLPFADASFAVVLSIGVLEHVREFGGAELASLQEIRRVLKPGGVFICAHFPNRRSLVEALARAAKKYHHRYTFGAADIQSLVQGSGFELLELERYGVLPRNTFSGRLAAIGNSPPAVASLEALDTLLSIPLNRFCQNYGFIARKPPTPAGP
jgi:SAM-dependent methyltransferase